MSVCDSSFATPCFLIEINFIYCSFAKLFFPLYLLCTKLSDHHSLDDEDDDVDDVAIDSFDLDNSNSSINNPTTDGLHSVHQQLQDSHVRTGIGTINSNNNDNSGNDELLNCLPKVKLSSSQENLNVDVSQTYPFGNLSL